MWKERLFGRVKMGIFEGIVVPSIMYGYEAWAVNGDEKVKALEMK